MERLPCGDRAFDLVFLGHVLHETDDLVGTLREQRRAARRRVAALEWPHRAEEAGPPLDHRLAPRDLFAAAREAGFLRVEEVPLVRMVLYRLHR